MTMAIIVNHDNDDMEITSMEEFERLIELAMSKSDFSSDVKVDYNDKVVVLSTCSYDYENARYVLIGVLRKI